MRYETLRTEPVVATPSPQLDPVVTAERTEVVRFHAASSPVDQKFVGEQLNAIQASLPIQRLAVLTHDGDRDPLALSGPESGSRIPRHRHHVILAEPIRRKEFVYA